MVEKGRKKGTVRFALKPENSAKKAMVAGSFSNWKPLELKKQKDGSFSATVTVPPGSIEYKFLVDDQWVMDPDNSAWALNPYGTLNSVWTVE